MESKIFNNELDIRLIELVRVNGALYDWRHKNYKDFTAKAEIWSLIAAELGKDVKDCQMRWKTIRDTYRRNQNKVISKITSGSPPVLRSKYMNKLKLKFLDRAPKRLRRPDLARPATADYTKATTNYHFETPPHSAGTEHDTSGVIPTPVSEICQDVHEYDYDQCQVQVNEIQTEKPEQNLSKRKKNLSEKLIDEIRLRREERSEILQSILNTKDNNEHKSKEHPVDLFFRSMSEIVKRFPPHLVAEARMKVCQAVTEVELKSLQQNPP